MATCPICEKAVVKNGSDHQESVFVKVPAKHGYSAAVKHSFDEFNNDMSPSHCC